MLRIVIIGLVIVELVLLTTFALAPADAAISNAEAAISDVENYIWAFASLDSNQVVCKKVVMHPEKRLQRSSSKEQVLKMRSTSTVVSDSYCANLAKPYQAESQPAQDLGQSLSESDDS
jgi:hypothetical protein